MVTGDLDRLGGEENRRPGLARKIALVLGIALAAFVLLLEAGSRIADHFVGSTRGPVKTAGRNGGLWEAIAFATIDPAAQKLEDARTIPHPYLGFALKPSYRTPEGAAQQCSHNSLGFRGKETTLAKPPGVFRIVTMGGSSVYGQSESNDEAVWSALLEKLLAEKRPAARIEVVNCGVSGYTSYEMLIELELMVMDLHPDLVVLYEAVNDMRSALYTKAFPVPKRDNTHWRATWPVDRPSPIEKLLEKSRAYLVWRFYLTDYKQRRQDLAYYTLVGYDGSPGIRLYCGQEQGYPGGKVPDEGFDFYRRNLENLFTIAEQRGAKVLIATQALMLWDMPARECAEIQVQSFRRIQQIQREVALAHGESFADTGARIEAEEDRIFRETKKHVFKNDVHPFDEGSALIARAVADALLESGLLP